MLAGFTGKLLKITKMTVLFNRTHNLSLILCQQPKLMRVLPQRHLLVFALLLPLVPACKPEPTPEDVALQFFEHLYNDHNLEKAELLVTNASRTKLHADFKYIEGALGLLADGREKEFEFKVEYAQTRMQGDSAFVYVWSSVDDSTMETLLIKEAEQWRIDFTYSKPTATAEALTKQVIEAEQATVFIPGVAADTARH